MNKRKAEKASLVEFLRSIKFEHAESTDNKTEHTGRFAHFYPRVRTGAKPTAEDTQLVRSAN